MSFILGAMGTHGRARSGGGAQSDAWAGKVLLGATGQTDWRRPGQRQRAGLEAVITAEVKTRRGGDPQQQCGEAENETEPTATRG